MVAAVDLMPLGLSTRTLTTTFLIALTASGFYYYQYKMPSLSSIRASNAAALGSTPYLPTAVFVGGTAGIGQGIAESFAHHTKGNARIFILGRNRQAAESIIASFPKPSSPEAKYEFIECDASLMKNVQRATKELVTQHGVEKINYLVMSQGFLSTNGFTDAGEGLDKKLAVHYYSKYKFIEGLLPQLLKAKEDGEDAKVISVLSAGKGLSRIDRDDLGLKKTFSVRKASAEGPAYNDLMVEEFAERYPTLTFGHAFPGIVRTSIASSPTLSPWMKIGMKTAMGLLYPLSVSQRECGEYLLHGLLTTMKTPGAYRISNVGADYDSDKKKNGKEWRASEEDRKALWEHTVEVTKVKDT
ncbi:hypothetical protein D9758_008687 [Tetrapyrgos nigripes]|uniref:NAD(P)-binding protein n=1 Tax=Tetrapyrgos nigripes TaxID=182062 RepID=A0A8H5FYB8_9AGAR|nr:hypothetical protein D9758_008687 [Tetrapyrgos nigripes]